MTIDIEYFLTTVTQEVKNRPVPVVDLIAIQTNDPFKVLVATILSARTKDETTALAASRLFKRANNIASLAAISQDEIQKLIYPVGFFRNKAGYLAKLPEALSHFNNIIPDTVEELIKLPGVGRKTANLVVSVAFQKPAICVDTHVHRIMNIWGYVHTETPLKTEMALRNLLPAKHWLEVNSLLVAFGQSICKPVSPHCDLCPLQEHCPKLDVKPRKEPRILNGNQTDLTFISWNVNGIRALEKKGFIELVQEFNVDVIALQETKAQPEQLSEQLLNIPGYKAFWNSAEKKGYSGVALYCKKRPERVLYGIGIDEFDNEGRVITAEYSNYFLVNVYFPNSASELKRLDYKLRFNAALKEFTDSLSEKKSVVLCGDYNVAHTEIDLKNPKTNKKNAGFTPEERSWMDSFIDAGYIDTFRKFNQDPGHYTWWSYRFSARTKDIGWRIDYFCVDSNSDERIVDSIILKDVMGSDHCPIKLTFSAK